VAGEAAGRIPMKSLLRDLSPIARTRGCRQISFTAQLDGLKVDRRRRSSMKNPEIARRALIWLDGLTPSWCSRTISESHPARQTAHAERLVPGIAERHQFGSCAGKHRLTTCCWVRGAA
jgi:hypothetical protein